MKQVTRLGAVLRVPGTRKNKRVPRIEFDPELIAGLRTASKVVLAVAAGAGVLTLAAVAPNIFQALDSVARLSKGTKLTAREKERKTAFAFYYLKKHGYIRLKPTGHDFFIKLTHRGRAKLEQLRIDSLRVKRAARWDKRWWQVAADIPTKNYRFGADRLRRQLKQMNFFPLQRTLWFYPFDPRAEINAITNAFGIGHFVTVMQVSYVDPDDEKLLIKHFKKMRIL